MELVADAADHRLAVFERRRQPRGHARYRRARAEESHPDQTSVQPRPNVKPKPASRAVLGSLVSASPGASSSRPRMNLRAAIGHVVDERAVAARADRRAQDEQVEFVFDHAARVALGLVEIDDAGVVRRGGIEFAPGDAVNADIGPASPNPRPSANGSTAAISIFVIGILFPSGRLGLSGRSTAARKPLAGYHRSVPALPPVEFGAQTDDIADRHDRRGLDRGFTCGGRGFRQGRHQHALPRCRRLADDRDRLAPASARRRSAARRCGQVLNDI